MGGMDTFADAVEALCTSFKKMNPFCIPFAIQNMGKFCCAGCAVGVLRGGAMHVMPLHAAHAVPCYAASCRSCHGASTAC